MLDQYVDHAHRIVEASPEEETNGTAAGLTLANTEHHPPTSNSPPHSTNPLDGGQQESKSLNRGQHQLPSSAKLTGLGTLALMHCFFQLRGIHTFCHMHDHELEKRLNVYVYKT